MTDPQPREHDSSAQTDEIVELSVRRAPKIGVFLLVGAVVGTLVALVLTFGFDGTAQADPTTGLDYTSGQVFGFLALVCIPVGLVLGGLVALAFDRASRRRSRSVTVDHETHS